MTFCNTDIAPGFVHKGTLSVALIVTVSNVGYNTIAGHIPDCKEKKDYGDGGRTAGILSIDGTKASSADDATIVGIVACEATFKSKVEVNAEAAGSASLADCTEKIKDLDSLVAKVAEVEPGPLASLTVNACETPDVVVKTKNFDGILSSSYDT